MTTRLGPRDVIEELKSNRVAFFRNALLRDDSGETRYTKLILGLILVLFVAEVVLALQAGARSTLAVVAYLFTNQPLIAYPLSPFLHGGIGHVVANVAGIFLAAPVEQRTSKRQYLGLLVLAGFLPVYADSVKFILYGSDPNIAGYGASAFALGLLGYGLAAQVGSEWRLTPRWWLIVVGGVLGVILVVENIVLSVGDPVSLHLGHLGGLLVGLAFGYHGRSQQPSGENEGEA